MNFTAKDSEPSKKADSLLSAAVANIIINGFLCYATIMMNIVTIYALRKTSSLSKPLKTLLLSLAVSDLGVGLLSQPMYIASLVEKELRSKNTPTLDTFSTIVSNILFLISFCSITALSADRFLAIQWPLRYQEIVTHRRVVIIVTAIWLVVVIFIPIDLLALFPKYPSASTAIFFTIHSLSFVSSTLTSFKIYITIRHHSIQIQTQTQHVTQNNGLANMARIKKSAQSTIWIYLVFWVCYLPYFFLYVYAFVKSTLPPRELQMFTVTLVLINSSLNPIIYCWKIRHFRPSILRILRRISNRNIGERSVYSFDG